MPRYGMTVDEKLCVTCNACVIACKNENKVPEGEARCWTAQEERGVFPLLTVETRSERCNHCENAPCVSACPTRASYYAEGGIVLVDPDKCVGCKVCTIACPYEVRYMGEPKRRLRFGVDQRARTVTPNELASWIIEGRRDFAVIDLRDQDEFKKGHVKEAVSCGSCHDTAEEGRKELEETQFIDLSKKLVLYTETGDETVDLPKSLAKNPRLYTLTGGYEAWQKQVLAPVVFGGETDLEQIRAKQKQEAVRAYFSGERPSTSVPAVLPLSPIKRKSTHQPAGPREGC